MDDFLYASEAAEVKAELKKALGTRPPPRIRYENQRIVLEYDSGTKMWISLKPLLIHAVGKGDLAEVKRLLSKGMSPNTGICLCT